MHMLWLENVCEMCGHSSVDKTMRILLDFYIVKGWEKDEYI